MPDNAQTQGDYRFLFIMAFTLPPTARYTLRPMAGPKEQSMMNYPDYAHLLRGVQWDLHPGPLAPHGDWPVEMREEFALIGAARLPIVREACASGKYNGIVLLGGGDPCFVEAREIGHRYGIPVTSCAHAQMHIANMVGNRFGIIDISEAHNMRMRDLVIQYGYADKCASIRNVNFPLPRPPYDDEYAIETERAQALRGEPSQMLEASVRESVAAIEEDGAEVIMLGCSAAFWMRPYLAQRLQALGWNIPVLEGYRCALEHLKLLVNLGLDASGLAFPIDHPKAWRRRKFV
jgi:Asp/Glu/hydantoin racemase